MVTIRHWLPLVWLLIILLLKDLPKLRWTLMKPCLMPPALTIFQQVPKPDHPITLPLTIPFDQKQTKAWSCREWPAFSATIWHKHLHLAALVSTRWDTQAGADGQGDACFGTWCGVLPWWPNMAEGGHYMWSGGASCQITVISPIWRTETQHKEVYEVDWNGPSEATEADEVWIPCCALGVAWILLLSGTW